MSKILNSKHPLMQNNFTKDDFDKVRVFLKKKPILTQSKKVEEFERKWSNWLGVKYSIFVNSGSSANYLTFYDFLGPHLFFLNFESIRLLTVFLFIFL